MGLIDILVIATFVISISFALYRGLVKELLSISSWILAGLGALYGFSYLRPFYGMFMENKTGIDLAGGATIALIILIVLAIISGKITGKLRKSSLSGLDRTLGFLFGAVRAILLITVVFLIAKIPFSRTQLDEAIEQNFTMPYIVHAGGMVQKFALQHFTDDMKENSLEAIKKASKKGVKTQETVTEYTEKQRESLDDLIEKTIDIEELD